VSENFDNPYENHGTSLRSIHGTIGPFSDVSYLTWEHR